ncbi:MAG: hypothetical protein H0X41_01265 [Chitinophagaceae bacterium]|nr:hypothetical protein [Chitinophagaceae bacterium]
MNKITYFGSSALWGMILLINAASCRKAGDIKTTPVKPEIQLLDESQRSPIERIKVVHLYKDTVYILSKMFTRQPGEQLIIDEGTLIKVNTSTPTGGIANAGISIYPGGIIQATGTRSNPIVFTSNDYTGNQKANWNGLVIRGNAPDNSAGPGGDPVDFSGTLSYVRIEFAPLILTAVGNRTIIDHIQVSYASPSGSYEFDGGTFNARNLISYACGGPGDFYITRGYTGKMQNILVIRHPFFGSTADVPLNTIAGLIIENNPDSSAAVTATPFTFPVISNITVLGPNTQNGSAPAYGDTNVISGAVLTTRSSCFAIRNSLLAGFPVAGWRLDDAPTATYFRDSISEFSHCIVHANITERTFYLKPGTAASYSSSDFQNYVLAPRFGNRLFTDIADLKLKDPFDYDRGPDAFPLEDSPVFTGSTFDGKYFNDAFFNRTNYIGALGQEDWTLGWSNNLPLKTNYNFPH